MLTALAILERELGAIDYEQHLLRRRLAGRLPKATGDGLRKELKDLDTRRAKTLRLLEDLHTEYEDRVEQRGEAIRARASRTPFTRREAPEEARRRLGLPDR